MAGLVDSIKAHNSNIFRRCYIKRRLASTGLFESTWTEITTDVKKWGKITQKIDAEKQSRIRFSSTQIVVANDEGRYNDEENAASLWFGYASQQRTLVRIDAGFQNQTLGSDGIYYNTETPNSEWDAALYDVGTYDSDATVFVGVLQGDMGSNSRNDMTLRVSPLTQIFRDYPAQNLTGWTSTGFTASQFVENLRDQTDSNGSYIFRPFFGDTTTNWNIETSTSVYPQLNTSTAEDVIDKNVWSIIEKLAEAEDYLSYVDNNGVFNFIGRDSILSTTSFEFHGLGSYDRTYGNTIKKVDYFGFRHSRYYSRVQIKHDAADTETSYEVVESAFSVSGGSTPWNFGHRTFNFENVWLDPTAASSLATRIFNNVSAKKNQFEFTASFVPHLNITDRLKITYDSNETQSNSLWDINDWAETSGAAETGLELVWDKNIGNSVYIQDDEYKHISIEVDLDRLETKIISREI